MKLSMTFRHMDASDAMKEYVEQKLERVQRHMRDPLVGHFVFEVDGGHTHRVTAQVSLHDGTVVKGEASSDTMYHSIDSVVSSIEKQVTRHKEKLT